MLDGQHAFPDERTAAVGVQLRREKNELACADLVQATSAVNHSAQRQLGAAAHVDVGPAAPARTLR